MFRVELRFPESIEIRYLERVPSPGKFIRGNHATWLVAEVEPDEAGGYVIRLRGPGASADRDTPERPRHDA